MRLLRSTGLPGRVARRLREEIRDTAALPRTAYLAARGRMIPFLEPYWQREECEAGAQWDERDRSGEARRAIEKDVPAFLGVEGITVATSSGRTAMQLALRALARRRPERRDVVIPSYCCRGLLAPILECGLTPVFADIGDDLNVGRDMLDGLVSERSLAVVIVHLGGAYAADTVKMIELADKFGAVAIEDVCQAFGGRGPGGAWGTQAPMTFFSFGLGKNVMATAGGLLIARIEQEAVLAERMGLGRECPGSAAARFAYMRRAFHRDGLRQLTGRPPIPREAFEASFGYHEMTELDALLLGYQLRRLPEILKRRDGNSRLLLDALAGTALAVPARSRPSVWTKFTVMAETAIAAERIRRYLAAAGVETEPMYTPLHLRNLVPAPNDRRLPRSEAVYERVFNLPVRPSLTGKQARYVAEAAASAAHEAELGSARQ